MTHSFEILVSDLAHLLRPVGSGAAAKVNPIYGCSLINLSPEGTVKFSSTDSVMSLSQWVRVDHHSGAGSAAIPRDRLAKILAAIPPAATVSLSFEDGDLSMRFGMVKYDFAGMPTAEFPPMISVSGDAKEILVDIAEIARAIRRVKASVYTGDSRPNLYGLNLRSCEGGIMAAGANGIAISTSLIKHDADGLDVTFPPDVSEVISRLTSGSEAKFTIGKNSISLSFEGLHYSSLVTGSPFVPYEALMSDGGDVTACQVDRGLLVDALRRLDVISEDRVGIVCDIEEKVLKLRTEARGLSGGYGYETIPCQTDGKKQKVGFHAGLLLATLKQSLSDEATIVISDGQKIFIETTDGKDIVMSKRVNFFQSEE